MSSYRCRHSVGTGKGDEDAEIASPCYRFAESTAVDVRERAKVAPFY